MEATFYSNKIDWQVASLPHIAHFVCSPWVSMDTLKLTLIGLKIFRKGVIGAGLSAFTHLPNQHSFISCQTVALFQKTSCLWVFQPVAQASQSVLLVLTSASSQDSIHSHLLRWFPVQRSESALWAPRSGVERKTSLPTRKAVSAALCSLLPLISLAAATHSCFLCFFFWGYFRTAVAAVVCCLVLSPLRGSQLTN